MLQSVSETKRPVLCGNTKEHKLHFKKINQVIQESHNHEAQPSRRTDRRSDEEQTTTQQNDAVTITDKREYVVNIPKSFYEKS